LPHMPFHYIPFFIRLFLPIRDPYKRLTLASPSSILRKVGIPHQLVAGSGGAGRYFPSAELLFGAKNHKTHPSGGTSKMIVSTGFKPVTNEPALRIRRLGASTAIATVF